MSSCRRFALEAELRREGLPEDEQLKILGELEKRESDFTRLQRTRLTADDFEPLTIIGRGAFGEVGICASVWAGSHMPAGQHVGFQGRSGQGRA